MEDNDGNCSELNIKPPTSSSDSCKDATYRQDPLVFILEKRSEEPKPKIHRKPKPRRPKTYVSSVSNCDSGLRCLGAGDAPTSEDDPKFKEKIARNEMARMYFANESARLMRCAGLGKFECQPWFPKPLAKKILPLPFCPSFLALTKTNKIEIDKRESDSAKIRQLKNEMDVFDAKIKAKGVCKCSKKVEDDAEVETEPMAISESNPNENIPTEDVPVEEFPSEMTLQSMAQMIKYLKLRASCDRDCQARTDCGFRRCIRFRRLLPTLSSIEEDLVHYTDSISPQRSKAEQKFIEEMEAVMNQDMFKRGSEDSNTVARNVLDVLLDTAAKSSKHRKQTSSRPPPQLSLEWRIEQFAKLWHFPLAAMLQGTVTPETSSKMAGNVLDVLIDTAVKSSEHKAETGYQPPSHICLEWRKEQFAKLWHQHLAAMTQGTLPSEASKKEARKVLDALIDTAIKSSEHKEETGCRPSHHLCLEWREEQFAELCKPG